MGHDPFSDQGIEVQISGTPVADETATVGKSNAGSVLSFSVGEMTF